MESRFTHFFFTVYLPIITGFRVNNFLNYELWFNPITFLNGFYSGKMTISCIFVILNFNILLELRIFNT